jgi:O-antigen biosynthesis protein WbqV
MIRLAGLRPEVDVAITYTGLRPGEKLFEEIFHGSEPPLPTGRPGILVAAPRSVDADEMGAALDELSQACRDRQPAMALAILRRLVPEYEPQGDNAAAVAVSG